jgi:hypothetical protein
MLAFLTEFSEQLPFLDKWWVSDVLVRPEHAPA